MTTPIGVGSDSTTAQQARGQKQAANTTMFIFLNIHSLYKINTNLSNHQL
jgi:hypothetical protein